MKKKIKALGILFLPYLVIILLPIFSVVCLSRILTEYYHQRILDERQASIQSAFDDFLLKIENIETLGYTIARNDLVHKYTAESLRQTNHQVMDTINVRDFLNSVMVNEVVKDVYLYDLYDNSVVAANTALKDASLFFEHTYRIDGLTAAECLERQKQLLSEYLYSPAVSSELYGAHIELIEYRIPLPLGKINNICSQLVMAIDAGHLFRSFDDVIQEEGEYYIYDSEGQLLYARGNQHKEILDQGMAVGLKPLFDAGDGWYGMVCHSDNQMWQAVIYVPEPLGAGAAPFFWSLVVLPILSSVLLCIYFTYRNHREIMELLHIFGKRNKNPEGQEQSETEYSYRIIREYADRLVHENDRLHGETSEYRVSRKYEILDRLIRNTYVSRREEEHALSSIDLQIANDQCVVFCIRFQDASYRTAISEGVTIKDYAKLVIQESMERRYELFDSSAREILCIISVEDDQDLRLIVSEIVSLLNVRICYPFGVELNMGAGKSVESLHSLHISFSQAKSVVNYNETAENKILLYTEMELLDDIYFYPKEYDEKIESYIILGQDLEAKRVIQEIYEENFVKNSRPISPNVSEKIMEKLFRCIRSLAAKYDITLEDGTKNIVLMYSDESGEDCTQNESRIRICFEQICDLVSQLSNEIEDKKKIVQNNSVQRILQYVNENYQDNNLALKQLSLEFGYHEKYLSNLFKRTTGENLSAYIERLRIEKAIELIRNSGMRIEEIAFEVGYTSDASFRRAFKRITGKSPSEYRE